MKETTVGRRQVMEHFDPPQWSRAAMVKIHPARLPNILWGKGTGASGRRQGRPRRDAHRDVNRPAARGLRRRRRATASAC